ncbi:MAG: fibronectin type III domain-containing protein [Deltaproteobacteria bacterium]|nr:fibronectin type III domain-containing protein [Deltaproteobacteria bacterium]
MRATIIAILVVGSGCNTLRKYITLEEPTPTPVEIPAPPKLPPTPTFLTTEYTTTADTVKVRFADVCQAGNCAYQIFKFRADDPTRRAWTDCGTKYPPRGNGEAESDPQDATCVLTGTPGRNDLTLEVTLEDHTTDNDTGAGLTPTRIAIRTRDEVGFTSEQATLTITHDSNPPAAPTSVEATAGNGTVIITWTPSTSPDVTGYNIYYGTSPADDDAWTDLNGRLAANGTSPVFVSGRQVGSLALANLPNGATIYAGVTARDGACKPLTETTPLGEPRCDDRGNESDKSLADVVAATPGEYSMRDLGKYLQPADRLARAVAVQGDVVVLVSTGLNDAAPKTYVETFDLRALTTVGAVLNGNAARLDDIELSETPRNGCKVPGPATMNPSLTNASKQILLYGRYAFVASGTGYVHVVDIANPRNLVNAWNDATTEAPTPGIGCAQGIDLHWPYLLVANGVQTDPDSTDNDDPGGIVAWKLTRAAQDKLAHAIVVECPDTAGGDAGQLDTAQTIVWMNDGGTNSRQAFGDIFVGVQGRTRSCPNVSLLDFCNGIANACSPVSGSGANSTTDVGRLHSEMPIMLQASTQGRLIVSKDANGNFFNNLDRHLPVDMQGPVFALTTSGRYVYAGVGNERGIDVIDLKNEEDPILIGNVFTAGDVRDLAVAGPYLVAVNEPKMGEENAGLRVFGLSQSFVLVNQGSRQMLSTVGMSGMRAFMSDPVPEQANTNFFQQPLRSLSYTPIPVTSGIGGLDDTCFQVGGQKGITTCGRRSPKAPAEGTKPCMTHASGTRPIWPAMCFPRDMTKSPTTTHGLDLYGPQLLMTFTSPGGAPIFRDAAIYDLVIAPDFFGAFNDGHVWDFGPLETYDFNNDANAAHTQGRVALPSGAGEAVMDATKLPSAGLLTAVQTVQAIRVVNRATKAVSSVQGLYGAAFGVDDLCGVRFMSGRAYMSCFKRDPNGLLMPLQVAQEVDLGASDCNSAAMVRQGQLAAISLIHSTDTNNVCEGVFVVDATAGAEPPLLPPAPVVTKLSLNTNYPSISMDGENVYVSCKLPSENLCQLRLRR